MTDFQNGNDTNPQPEGMNPQPQSGYQDPYGNPQGTYANPQNPYGNDYSYGSPYAPEYEEPVGLGSYLGMLIINAIPVVGLIMDVVWGASGSTKSRKNFGWAALIARVIVAAVAIGLVTAISVGMIALFTNAYERRGDDFITDYVEEWENDLEDFSEAWQVDHSDWDDSDAGMWDDSDGGEWDDSAAGEWYDSDFDLDGEYDPSIPAVTEGIHTYDAETGSFVFDINGEEVVASPLSYGDFQNLNLRMTGVNNYDDSDLGMWVYHVDPNRADVDVFLETEKLDVNADTNVFSAIMYLYDTPSSCMGLTCNSGYAEVMDVLQSMGAGIEEDTYDTEEGYGSVEASLGFDYRLVFQIDDGHLISITFRQPVG